MAEATAEMAEATAEMAEATEEMAEAKICCKNTGKTWGGKCYQKCNSYCKRNHYRYGKCVRRHSRWPVCYCCNNCRDDVVDYDEYLI